MAPGLPASDFGLVILLFRLEAGLGAGVDLGLGFRHAPAPGFAAKKKSTYDPQKDTDAHRADTERYHRQVDAVPLDERLYLDETGAHLNMTLPYGRAPQAERCVDTKPVAPGAAVNTVAILTEQGLADAWCYSGTLTARVFVAYLDTFLLPLLLTGKTLILDNHPVHRSRRVLAFFERHQIQYI